MESAMRGNSAMLTVAILLLAGSGCASMPRWVSWQPPWRRTAPCTFNQNATKEQIVAHVSRFATADGDRPALASWRAMQAKINFPGMPAVPATIDVEGPSRLRIRAIMPFSNSEMADIGCNDEEMWIWHRNDPEKIVTIKHEHIRLALRQMPVPFDPNWLMEILGVAPMHLDDYELRKPNDEKAKWVDLVARRTAPSGESVLRVVRINLCYGQIVEHRIEQLDRTLIASAALEGYAPDATGKFVMPHLVQIDWPARNASLRLELGPIHANPTPLADANWSVPRIAGAQLVQFLPPGGAPVESPYYESPQVEIAEAPREPGDRLTRDALIDPDARMDVRPEGGSATVRPGGYSPAASRSSSGRRPPEPESGPPPFPSRL